MNKVVIIAEAGVNHNGNIKIAKKMIDVAADAGVDYVKFQSFKANKLVSPRALKASYQKKNLAGADDKQIQMLKGLELTHNQHLELIKYTKGKGILFLSSAFDEDGLEYLDTLGLDVFKCPSGEITNYPYIKKLAKLKKPVILSTGMSTMLEIESALKILTSEGLLREQITVLHCNTQYPTPMIDVNLKAMNTIASELDVQVGYSDHTLGIEVPIAAVALGGRIIEKHFTLDRSLPGPDHAASLEPTELKKMVSAIRNIELALSGDRKKNPSSSEQENLQIVRKSIHLRRRMKRGQIINESDIIPLRPGDGISPMNWERVLGKKIKFDLPEFHKLSMNDME